MIKKRLTKKHKIAGLTALVLLGLSVVYTVKPSLLLLPVYRSIYAQKTQDAFKDAQEQLQPILTFVNAEPSMPSSCSYKAPPRVFYRHLACMQSTQGNRTLTKTDDQDLEKWAETAYRRLRGNHWTASAPQSPYGGDWHQTDNAAIKNLPKESEYWVKYTKSFKGIACTLDIKSYPEPQTPSEKRTLQVSQLCGHILKLPFPEGL